MIILTDEDYEKALANNDVGFFETESTPYEGGYVDGKCVSVDYITKVAEYGSEPARFTFKDAFVSYSSIEGLGKLIRDTPRYPLEKKDEYIQKFYAQFETWKWYYYEGLKREHFMLYMNDVIENKTTESIESFYSSIVEFHDWNTSDKHWSIQFMIDSQLNWVDGVVPVIDL